MSPPRGYSTGWIPGPLMFRTTPLLSRNEEKLRPIAHTMRDPERVPGTFKAVDDGNVGVGTETVPIVWDRKRNREPWTHFEFGHRAIVVVYAARHRDRGSNRAQTNAGVHVVALTNSRPQRSRVHQRLLA